MIEISEVPPAVPEQTDPENTPVAPVDPPELIQVLSCNGQSCHVVQRADGWHVIVKILDTGETFDDGTWILDAEQYANWKRVLSQFQ